MLLVLPAVKMKDSETDRHKRAFWDLLQLQEAASPSKFATWQWWSACLMRWCVSPQVCARWRAPQTQLGVCSKTRRLSDNIISVSVSVCITSAFFSILPLSPASLPSVSLDGGNRWKSIHRETHIIHSLCYVSEADQCAGVEICAATRWQWGESIDNSLCRHEVWARVVVVSLPVELHTKRSSHNCEAATASTARVALIQESCRLVACVVLPPPPRPASNYRLHAPKRQFAWQPSSSGCSCCRVFSDQTYCPDENKTHISCLRSHQNAKKRSVVVALKPPVGSPTPQPGSTTRN